MAIRYIVHYGAMQLLGVFSHADLVLRHGSRIIVKTPRGQEVGIVRCEATPETLAKFDSGSIENRIIRLMTETDEMDNQKLRQGEQAKLECCKRIVQESGIGMDLVRVEHIFSGERIVVYYTAEGRVDFRELVKLLGTEWQLRIEMRQISVRDKMKLLVPIGDCGREICCGCYLHETPIITIRMAKLQKVALDPAKISGHCGRLKCCMSYEYEGYVGEQKN